MILFGPVPHQILKPSSSPLVIPPIILFFVASFLWFVLGDLHVLLVCFTSHGLKPCDHQYPPSFYDGGFHHSFDASLSIYALPSPPPMLVTFFTSIVFVFVRSAIWWISFSSCFSFAVNCSCLSTMCAWNFVDRDTMWQLLFKICYTCSLSSATAPDKVSNHPQTSPSCWCSSLAL